jgi:chaperone modulatory protein CbpM
VGYALVLVRSASLDLETFARTTGTHPDLVRRLVALDILEADRDAAGELWFARSQVAVMGRVQRLRAGFGLNYVAVGLVADLLDRIAVLETALREAQRPSPPPQAAR